jgi:hypothetical protein
VHFQRDVSNGKFVAKVVPADPFMVEATKKSFVMSGVVELEQDHMLESPIDESMISSQMEVGYFFEEEEDDSAPSSEYPSAWHRERYMQYDVHGMWKFERFVCGDIESSVDFLHGFLNHSYKMACGRDFKVNKNKAWSDGFINTREYGLQDDGSLGFDPKSISDTMKEVMVLSSNMVSMHRNVKFSCIGDVIGDPTGQGNVSHTELIHEFMCVHWANWFCSDKIIGNRDINKLRLLQEIPHILKPTNREYLYLISQFQDEFANKITTNIVTLKRLLGHFCYPYVESDVKLSKHFLFDPAKPILPFRNDSFRFDGAEDFPPPIWEEMP